MILRQETLDRFDYDPVRNPPTHRQSVVWQYPCCGLTVTQKYSLAKQRCFRCSVQDRREARKSNAIEPMTVTTKLLHGQLVQVKIYSTGAPADYVPSFLEYEEGGDGDDTDDLY